jgi:hypothetical protein
LPGTRSIENPSRRARSDPYPGRINRPDRSTPIGPNHTVPSGTVPVVARIPGNKLPGYDHSVPPGQTALRANSPRRRFAHLPFRFSPGRFPFLRGYQAINYLATIIQSLRDKGAPREFAPSPFRPFAVSLLSGYFVEKVKPTVVEPPWFTAPTLTSYTWFDSKPVTWKFVFLVTKVWATSLRR